MTAPQRKRAEPDRTVLLVEDDEQAIKIFSLYLIQAGYRVLIARTGEQALALAAARHPAAIVLDILLPGIDGWDVLAELKASSATHDIPVVIVSVLDRQALGFQLGAMEYLVKPVDRVHLLRALERCMLYDQLAGRTPRVLLVHEDPAELEALSLMLTAHGYEVIQAQGGVEAVDLARTMRPDLVVLDLRLSGMDCFDVVAALRAEPTTGSVPIRILTAKGLTAAQKLRLSDKVRSIVMTGEAARETLLTAVSRIFYDVEAEP